jgi:hypothetical protein
MKKIMISILALTMIYSAALADCYGHDYQVNGEILPSCEEQGWRHYVCALCGADGGAEMIPPTGHSWGAWETVQEPTCTNAGTVRRVCAQCGKTDEQTSGDALGHEWALEESVPPTTEAEGRETYVCKRDRNHIHYVLIAKLEREPEQPEQPEEQEEQEEEPAALTCEELGHDWGKWETVREPGCAQVGCRKRVCRRDESHTETEAIAPTGNHNWSKWKVEIPETDREPEMLERHCWECGKEEYVYGEYKQSPEKESGKNTSGNEVTVNTNIFIELLLLLMLRMIFR